MATKERAIDRGRQRGRYVRTELGRERRECRLAAGLSLSAVGRAVGLHATNVGRIERAAVSGVSIQRMAELFAVVGHELGCRAYPAGPPLRDAAHVALIRRAKARIGGRWHWRAEAPVTADPGDARAWDALLESPSARVGLEAETRLRDVQALQRRIEAKVRDGAVSCVVLVVADTRGNRAAVAAAGPILALTFPVLPIAAWAALRAGRDPGGNALLFA